MDYFFIHETYSTLRGTHITAGRHTIYLLGSQFVHFGVAAGMNIEPPNHSSSCSANTPENLEVIHDNMLYTAVGPRGFDNVVVVVPLRDSPLALCVHQRAACYIWVLSSNLADRSKLFSTSSSYHRITHPPLFQPRHHQCYFVFSKCSDPSTLRSWRTIIGPHHILSKFNRRCMQWIYRHTSNGLSLWCFYNDVEKCVQVEGA